MSAVRIASHVAANGSAAPVALGGEPAAPADWPGARDPNESVELRDMVSVACTYFDRGMIDDAEEMVEEALAAGYSRQDAVDLHLRIRAVRSASVQVATAGTLNSAVPEPVASDEEFTIPLPGIDAQHGAVREAMAASDDDVLAGRLESALDATLAAIGNAPDYLPAFIRVAELQAASGDHAAAEETVRLLRRCLALASDESDWLQLSMRVMLDPNDGEALIALARALLAQRGLMQLDPYVPDAIEHARSCDPQAALELANEYLQLRPNDEGALRLRLQAIVGASSDEEIVHAIRRDVHPRMAADLLLLRSAVGLTDGRDEWFTWLERCVARILESTPNPTDMSRAIDASRRLMPHAQHALATAVVRVATGDAYGALDVLAPWLAGPTRETSDAREMLVAACARAFAQRAASPIESIDALAKAVGQAVVIDVRPFAEGCRLFARAISAEALMRELVGVARETGQQELAIGYLQTLRDRMPEHLEIRTGLADLQVAAGRIADGVRELRYIAERYEQAGNLDRMVDAMRHISNAVPGNADIKAKLIDSYIQRGIPDEATRELRLLGDLHLKRGRAAEAGAAYVRGAEIAATTGNTRRAIDLFERAVAADPDNVAVRHASVAFFIMNGAVDRATLQLWEIVRIAMQADDPDEAVAALHQIIALAPGDASAYHRLGEILTHVEEYAQAERVYRRLSQLTPDDPVLIAKQSALAALASER